MKLFDFGQSNCRRTLGAILLLLFLPALLPAQNPDTISVDVNVVVLHATVRDRRGGFVSNLTKDAFHVSEDGRPQAIQFFQTEDVPVSVGLIVDDSTSMAPKRKDVIAAAGEFVKSSNPKDELFVVNFNEKTALGLPRGQAFSDKAMELEKALNVTPGGRTALYDAIEEGLSHLTQASHEKKVLIVVSDGGDNASRHSLAQVIQDAERSDVIIYTIGLFDPEDRDKNPGVLRRLANETGGETFLPNDSSEATSICRRIAADIRHQYTIAYEPTNRAWDNTYRKVKVIAIGTHGAKLSVRTREGYIAAARQGSH